MEHEIWQKWALNLQQKKMTAFALVLIEGAGPLRILASQFMLGCAPLINQVGSTPWNSFAKMLEDSEQCRSFASFLREEKVS